MKYLVGIDEAGRGPLAGPVCVAAVCLKRGVFDPRQLKGVRDSKKLTVAQREEWFKKACAWKKKGKLNFAFSMVGSRIIDRRGIVFAIGLALSRTLKKLRVSPRQSRILLDGSLRAPRVFATQQTIIGGDDKVPLISMASVVAKVSRDRKMVRLAKLFPKFKLAEHKGYGSAEHIKIIRRHGLSTIHRRTFCGAFVR